MRIPGEVSRPFSHGPVPIFVLAALLNACATESSLTAQIAPLAGLTRAGAASGDLMYVLTTDNDVLVLSYPDGSPVADISGLRGSPISACSDSRGHVFVTTSYANSLGYIYEFAHGGTTPIATLTDPGFPSGCSVDPTTGDLAVANQFSHVFGDAGNVAIFRHARGKAIPIKDASVSEFYSCGYDAKGNLFTDAAGAGYIAYPLLPKGSHVFTKVFFNQQLFGVAGPIRWDGKYFVIGYSEPNAVYRLTVSGSNGVVISALQLQYRQDEPYGDFAIYGHTIVAPDWFGHGSYGIGFWSYPAGGPPLKLLAPVDKRDSTYSIAISVASKR